MKYLRANLRIIFATLAGFAFVGGIGVFKAQADSWDKKTILTINEPVQVRERLLEPGTYVFKLLNSPSERHVVQIFNADQSHIIDTVLAIPNYRLQPTGNSRFAFWETPAGYNKAMRAWFYPGDNFGQEFPYPKHLAAIQTAALVVPTPAPTPEPEAKAETPAPTPEPVREPEPTPTQPTEVAKAEPEPTPAAEPTPEQTPAPQTPATQTPTAEPAQTLPKTGSPYPFIGLAGLGCLGLYRLMRRREIGS